MRARNVFLAVSVALAAFPHAASAQSVDSLRAQIEALLGQITALQQQVLQVKQPASTPAGFGEVRACPAFTRNLSRGDNGTDVFALQSFLLREQFLAQDSVSGFFGPITESALQRWQAMKGVVSSGTPATTGWGVLGARTRAAIAAACGGLSGFEFSATPPSGNAPVTVLFVVPFGDHANTRPSFVDGQDTVLDFGDGAEPLWIQCPGSNGRCVTPTRVQHTYLSAGTFSATLKKTGGRCAGTCPTAVLGSARIQVTSTARPTCAIAVSPPSVPVGQQTTLAWTTGNAVSALLATDAGSISVPLQGTRTVTVPSAGTFTYEMSVTNANGVQGRCSATITAGTSAAVVGTSLNASPAVGNAPLTVRFTGSVQGAGYSIDFGDGQTSGAIGCAHGACPVTTGATAVDVSTTYASAGTYRVKLRRHFSTLEGNCAGLDCNVVASVAVNVAGAGASTAPMTVSMPPFSDRIDRGTQFPVSWVATNVPAGGKVFLELIAVSGATRGGVIADKLEPVGIFAWRIPPLTDHAVVAGDYFLHGIDIVDGATYKLRATLYVPTTAQCAGGCPPSMGALIQAAETGTFRIGTN